jgi:hypothetical protein
MVFWNKKKEEIDEDTVIAEPVSPPPSSSPSSSSPPPQQPTVESAQFDMIEQVYDSAKHVWGFGKGIIIFSPFMGIAEGVATKAVNMVGVESLEKADEIIKMSIINTEKTIIDPAVLQLLEIVGPVLGFSDDVVKQVISTVVKPKIMAETVAVATTVVTEVVPQQEVTDELTTEMSDKVKTITKKDRSVDYINLILTIGILASFSYSIACYMGFEPDVSLQKVQDIGLEKFQNLTATT